MAPLEIGYWSLLAMAVLLLLRLPVAIVLGGVSILGIWAVRGMRPATSFLGNDPFEFAANWTLSAVPMFILLGAIAFRAGFTEAIFRAARMWFSGIPGALAIATNWACAVFAAISGSTIATTAAIGKLSINEMLRFGYDKGLATGVVAAAGTLGALIPPSIAFVIYGWYAEASIARLLIAGIVPGLLTAAVYTSLILWRCHRDPALAPQPVEHYTRKEKLGALGEIWPIPTILLGIVASLYSGYATPTEAAAVGTAFTLVVAAFKRTLTWANLKGAIGDTLRSSGAIFFIVVGAGLFAKFLALTGVPSDIANMIRAAELSTLKFVLVVIGIYLVMGCFMDGLGIMLITLPILIPICRELGLDLIWMGVLVVKLIEIGSITPPFGMHVFVVKGIVGRTVSLITIFRGCFWFLGAEVLIMTLLVAFPILSTGLPALMG